MAGEKSFSYTPSNISETSKMSGSSRALLATGAINSIIDLFASTFLVSFIMSINSSAISESLLSISLYYITLYIMQMIGYYVLNIFVDKTNRVGFYRVGIILKGAFIVCLIFMGKQLANYSMLAGALFGLSNAFYYSSYNIIKCEMVSRHHADKFNLVQQVLSKVINVIFPVLIGMLIDVTTFLSVAFYVLGIVVVQFVISFFIKSRRPAYSAFQFKQYIKKLKTNTPDMQRIKTTYKIAFSYGLSSINSTVLTFLAIYTFKTNLNLGIFTAIFAFVSIILITIFRKTTKVGNRKWWLIVLAVMTVGASILVICDVSKWTYIVYNLILTPSLCVYAYVLEYHRSIILKKTNHYEDIAEHQTVTEFCFITTRVFTYVMMLVLGLTLELTGFKIIVGILSISFPLQCYFMIKMEKEEVKHPVEIIETRVVEVIEEPHEEDK